MGKAHQSWWLSRASEHHTFFRNRDIIAHAILQLPKVAAGLMASASWHPIEIGSAETASDCLFDAEPPETGSVDPKPFQRWPATLHRQMRRSLRRRPPNGHFPNISNRSR